MKFIDIKLLKFAIIGVLNTIVGTAIMFGLYNLLGCSYWISSAANYVFGSILSYVLNKKFTFNHKGDVAGSGMRFIANIAVCYLMAYGIAKPLAIWSMSGFSIKVQENIAMFIGMILFTGFNYIGQRYFVFKEKKVDEE